MSHLKHIRVIAPLAVFLVILTVVATVRGSLVRASTAITPLVTVSSPSPYATCTIGGPGTTYVNADVEPYVAVNPANTSNIIGVWQQDRWSNGGAHGLVAGVSTDGGSTWTKVSLPFSQCAGGLDYQRASDPWVSFGPDGTAYAVSISFDGSDNKNAVGAATSTDGGQTWNHLQTIVSYTSNGGHFDEVALSTSTDGGVTWSTPVRVNTPTGGPAFTPSIHVNSKGTVGVTYYDFRNLTTQTSTLPTDYWFTSSTNHGTSFGNEVHIAGSFDMLTAPNASGFFVGDYEGLDTSGTTFRPIFVQANSGNTANRTDVFT